MRNDDDDDEMLEGHLRKNTNFTSTFVFPSFYLLIQLLFQNSKIPLWPLLICVYVQCWRCCDSRPRLLPIPPHPPSVGGAVTPAHGCSPLHNMVTLDQFKRWAVSYTTACTGVDNNSQCWIFFKDVSKTIKACSRELPGPVIQVLFPSVYVLLVSFLWILFAKKVKTAITPKNIIKPISRIKKIPYQAPPTQLGPRKCTF